jgi:site-specific recombinase XerD
MGDDGRFSRRVLAPQRATNALFRKAVPAYLDFLRKHRGLSARTVSKRAFQLTLFTDYLERVGVSTWKDSPPSALRTFLVTQLTGKKPATRLSYASTLRSFHRWASLHGLLERDLSAATATVRQYRLAGIPDVLTDDEVAALLQAVDRSTALGKRDYAVLLLAARYGLRPGDIRQLSLDHINWRGRQIALPQAKTGRLLVLPVLPEVPTLSSTTCAMVGRRPSFATSSCGTWLLMSPSHRRTTCRRLSGRPFAERDWTKGPSGRGSTCSVTRSSRGCCTRATRSRPSPMFWDTCI